MAVNKQFGGPMFMGITGTVPTYYDTAAGRELPQSYTTDPASGALRPATTEDRPDPNAALTWYQDFFTPSGTLSYAATRPQNVPALPGVIARAQWEDYVKRFMPYEDALMAQTYYDNPEMVQREVAKGQQQAEAAIQTGKGVQARRLKAMGQYVSPEERERLDRRWDLQRNLATVDAANRIRQNIAARSRDIAFGGSSARSAIDLKTQTGTGGQ